MAETHSGLHERSCLPRQEVEQRNDRIRSIFIINKQHSLLVKFRVISCSVNLFGHSEEPAEAGENQHRHPRHVYNSTIITCNPSTVTVHETCTCNSCLNVASTNSSVSLSLFHQHQHLISLSTRLLTFPHSKTFLTVFCLSVSVITLCIISLKHKWVPHFNLIPTQVKTLMQVAVTVKTSSDSIKHCSAGPHSTNVPARVITKWGQS